MLPDIEGEVRPLQLEIPAYSEMAKLAIPVLYRQINDLDVYVEDQSLVGLYENLIKSVIGRRARLVKVFDLPGRAAVIAQARLLSTDRSRVRVFICDPDIRMLSGNSEPKSRNLYQWDKYCLENALCSPASIVNAVSSLASVDSPTETLRKFDVDCLEASVLRLAEVHALWAVAFKLGKSDPSLEHKISQFIDFGGEVCVVCPSKLAAQVAKIRQFLFDTLDAQTTLELEKLKDDLSNKYVVDPFRYIDGKTFLMALIFKKIQTKLGIQMKADLKYAFLLPYFDRKWNIKFVRYIQARARAASSMRASSER